MCACLADGKARWHSAIEGGLDRLLSLEWQESRGCNSAECPGKAMPAIEAWLLRITLPQVQMSRLGERERRKVRGAPHQGKTPVPTLVDL